MAAPEVRTDRYLDWVDCISADAHQLQAFSTDRHLLSDLGVDSVIIFVCGGVAHGILGKLGQLLTEASILRLRRVWTRCKRLKSDDDPSDADTAGEFGHDNLPEDAIDAIDAILAAIEEIGPHEAQPMLQAEFVRLGFEKDTAEALSKRLLDPPLN
jgi:hypothetical protein